MKAQWKSEALIFLHFFSVLALSVSLYLRGSLNKRGDSQLRTQYRAGGPPGEDLLRATVAKTERGSQRRMGARGFQRQLFPNRSTCFMRPSTKLEHRRRTRSPGLLVLVKKMPASAGRLDFELFGK